MSSATEQAVRNYLQYLKDPESLRDNDLIESLREESENETDPLKSLALFERLTEAQELPENKFLDPFIQHALSYAESKGLSAEAFIQLGVSRQALRDAGFEVKGRGGRRNTENSVGCDDVMSEIESWESGRIFTTPEVVAATGTSSATATKAIKSLEETGLVIPLGQDPDFEGAGRSPNRFERA